MRTSRTLAGIAAGALALVLAGCSAPTSAGESSGTAAAGPVETVKVGYIGDYTGTSLVAIADKQDLWAKHGLKAELSTFTNGPLQVQALKTGDLDVGYVGPGALWMPFSGQAKILTVDGVGKADRVIAQPGITSMKQLRGKKVAVAEGTSGDMILTLALEKAGMSKSDVEIVTMDPSTIVSAFSSKQVDAAGLWYPLIDTIKKQVPDLKELAKDADFAKEVSFPNAIVGGVDFVTKHPETAKKVNAVLRDAMDYRAKNGSETIKLVAAQLKVDEATVKADATNVQVFTAAELDKLTKDGTVDSWFTGMNDYFVKAGKLQKAEKVFSYYDADLYTTAGE